jgi:hypothetical protein
VVIAVAFGAVLAICRRGSAGGFRLSMWALRATWALFF